MDGGAPPVVAVVWAPDSGPGLKVSLASLVASDYPDLTVLVVPADGALGVAEATQALLPSAFIADPVAGEPAVAAANRAAAMVGGAAYLLFLSPGYRLDPSALSRLVEVAVRENAGLVTPKVVHDDDRDVLIHVGQAVDRFGVTVERVQFGEIDQGQHDAVREVAVAPSGATLVRTDLFSSLGGLDEHLAGAGSDVDLSWRARVAGARVFAAPSAVATRHVSADELNDGYVEDHEQGLEDLAAERRAEIHHLVVNESAAQLLLVLPLALLLSLAEAAVHWGGRHRERAGAILGAWRWMLANAKALRARRAEVQQLRTASDRKLRAEMVGGSSRLKEFGVQLWHQGLDVARGEQAELQVDEPGSPGSFGGAFSDDQGFDELDDLGYRGERGPRRHALLGSRRSRLVVWVLLWFWWLYATRSLFGPALPKIGELGTVESFTRGFSSWWQGWHPSGVGTTAAQATTGPVLSLLSLPALGHTSLVLKVFLLASFPLFVLGVTRLLKPVASPRARLAAAVAAAGVGACANAVAMGRLSWLVGLVAAPWLLGGILRLHGVAIAERSAAPSTWFAAKIGLGLGLAATFTPALLVVFLLAAFGVSVVLPSRWRLVAWRGIALALGLAMLINLPLLLEASSAGWDGLAIFGLPAASWSNVAPLDLLTFGIGPHVHRDATLLLMAAALFSLVAARAERFSLSLGLLGGALLPTAVALLTSDGLGVHLAVDPGVLLVPLAVAVPAMVGLGVAAVEEDLAGLSFGWRQAAAAMAALAAVLGILPAGSAVAGGRLGLPGVGYGTLTSVPDQAPPGRVLWVGNPLAIPGRAWSAAPGIAYAIGDLHSTRSASLAPVSPPGPAAGLGEVAMEVADRQTVHAGLLVAPYAIKYVAVVGASAPEIGNSSGTSVPLDPRLVPGFNRQQDLSRVPSPQGVTLYKVREPVPTLAQRSTPAPTVSSPLHPSAVLDWRPLARGNLRRSTTVEASDGNAVVAVAPSSAVHLEGAGRRQAAFGWGTQLIGTHGSLKITLADGLAGIRNVTVQLLALGLVFQLARRARRRWRAGTP